MIYEHAAGFVGRKPWELRVTRSCSLKRTGAPGSNTDQQVIAVGIDIHNHEAGAAGARIEPCAANAIPAIQEPLLSLLDGGLALKAV